MVIFPSWFYVFQLLFYLLICCVFSCKMQEFWGSKGIASFLELYLAETLRYHSSKRVTLWALYSVCNYEDCLDSKTMEYILSHTLMNF